MGPPAYGTQLKTLTQFKADSADLSPEQLAVMLPDLRKACPSFEIDDKLQITAKERFQYSNIEGGYAQDFLDLLYGGAEKTKVIDRSIEQTNMTELMVTAMGSYRDQHREQLTAEFEQVNETRLVESDEICDLYQEAIDKELYGDEGELYVEQRREEVLAKRAHLSHVCMENILQTMFAQLEKEGKVRRAVEGYAMEDSEMAMETFLDMSLKKAAKEYDIPPELILYTKEVLMQSVRDTHITKNRMGADITKVARTTQQIMRWSLAEEVEVFEAEQRAQATYLGDRHSQVPMLIPRVLRLRDLLQSLDQPSELAMEQRAPALFLTLGHHHVSLSYVFADAALNHCFLQGVIHMGDDATTEQCMVWCDTFNHLSCHATALVGEDGLRIRESYLEWDAPITGTTLSAFLQLLQEDIHTMDFLTHHLAQNSDIR